ncbi:2-acylglycerol O-acyltransferase protein [Dioscorea alata]|uniref:2-acylglycerol O-acyltransferase protein n=3 Tax=Dioscorea alata TaxID=55571 RepID=A0ACB7W530_DIOAL|nr:2-acylglycerol O-acyltransferase protein [Dioscorea alata]
MASKPPTLPEKLLRPPAHDAIRVCLRCRRRVAVVTPMKWEGVDEKLAKMVSEANLDHASERRRIREMFKDIQLSIDHCLFKAQYSGVKTEEFYRVNSRGLEIFSRRWFPDSLPMKALVCFCHGYGDTCTFFIEGIAKKLASSGYGVFAMDYPGFGLSEGLHGYIPSFDNLVDDVVEHYTKIKENPEYQGLPSFLFGQSMGGAVALKVHFKQPNAWDGAVLVAPMCKMAEDVVPSWPVQQILICMAKILPKGKLVPQKDLAEMAFKDVKKREQTSYNVIAYKDKPRLRTALEMLRTTQELENQLQEVSLPLLILHGEADIVTDPSVSKALYEKANSKDKKLCLYKDAYHSLLEGEPDEMIFQILDDIISWLDEHCIKAGASRSIPP